MASTLDDQPPARVLVFFRFVDGEELEARFGFDLGSRARGQLERDPIEGEGQLIAGNAFFFGQWIGTNERRISFHVRKSGMSDKHPAEFRLAYNELPQAEFTTLLVLREKNSPRIDAEQVLS